MRETDGWVDLHLGFDKLRGLGRSSEVIVRHESVVGTVLGSSG